MNAVSRHTTAWRRCLQIVTLLFLLRLAGMWIALPAGMPAPASGFPWNEIANGLLLMFLGLIWSRLRLSWPSQVLTFGLAVYGMLAAWSATLPAPQRGVIGFGSGYVSLQGPVVGLSGSALLALMAVCLFTLWGLRAPSRNDPAQRRPEATDPSGAAGLNRPSAAPAWPDRAVPPPPAR